MISDEDVDRRVSTRRAALRAQLEVAAEVGYGTKPISLALQTHPDVILVAVEEPVGRPLETAESLANVLPNTPIIIYSSINDPEAIRRAMLMGARDYILQPVQPDQLQEAMDAVLVQEERRQMRRSGQLLNELGRGHRGHRHGRQGRRRQNGGRSQPGPGAVAGDRHVGGHIRCS